VGYYQTKAEQGSVRFASINGIGSVDAITQKLFEVLDVAH